MIKLQIDEKRNIDPAHSCNQILENLFSSMFLQKLLTLQTLFKGNGSVTVLVIIKLTNFRDTVRLCCGSCKLNFVIILSYFAIFKNVVHGLMPGEMPSHSASHQAPNYVQRS